MSEDTKPEQPTSRFNLDAINKWMTLAANIGVFLGVVILVIELQQSRELMAAQLNVERSMANAAVEEAFADPHTAAVYTKMVTDPASMTLDEVRTADSLLVRAIWHFRLALHLENQGLVAPGTTRATMSGQGRVYFGNAFAQNWWAIEREQGWSGEIQEMMDEELARLGEGRTQEWLESIQLTSEDLAESTEP